MAEESAEVTKEVLAPAEGPRENLISTAVKFLQNPKVQQSPLYQRKAFLEKKGLTSEEIDLAVKRAGVTDITHQPPPQPQYPPSLAQQALVAPQPIPVPLPTAWSRARDFATTAVIVSSISYAVYRIFQVYIRPWLFGKSAHDNSRFDRLEKQLEQLETMNETMSQIQSTLKSIQESITAQQNIAAETSVKTTDSCSIQEVRNEVVSLKGLLLSRKQFAPAPQTTPILPAWQLSSSSATSSSSSSSQSNNIDAVSTSTSEPSVIEEKFEETGGDNSNSQEMPFQAVAPEASTAPKEVHDSAAAVTAKDSESRDKDENEEVGQVSSPVS